MKLIALETSGRHGSLCALEADAEEERLCREVALPPDRRSAQSLGPCLRELLDGLGWRTEEISAVAVASGPGSFTGLRVGVTAAKMLAYVAQCGVVEVSTPEVLAAQAGSTGGAVWAVLDAQRNELFAARYQGPTTASSIEVLRQSTFLSKLSAGERVTGPITDKLTLPQGVLAAPYECWAPRSETVARLALPRALAGDTTRPEDLVPRYHRLSAAEEKRLRAESV